MKPSSWSPTCSGQAQRPHRRRKRRGMGVTFIIIALVLVVLAISGLSVQYFTRGAARVAESVLAGEQALNIAQAALAEAWSLTECLVNEPSTELHRLLTKPLEIGSENSLGFTVMPKATKTYFSNDPNVELTDVQLVAPRQYPIWRQNPYEKLGIIGAEVTVKVRRPGIDRWATRTLTQFREFKVVYPSPPRPFDRFTLFVTVPDFLVGYERQYRELMCRVDAKLRETERKLSRRRRGRRRRRVRLPRPFQANAVDVYKFYPHYRYPSFPYNARAPRPSSYSTRIPDEVTDMDNHILSVEPVLRGKDFKLMWPDTVNNLPAFEQGIRETLDTFAQRFLYLGQETLREWRECYLLPHLSGGGEDAITVDDNIEYCKNFRATHVFPNEEALWEEVGKDDCYLDGIYYVDGPIDDLSITYRGQGAIIGKHRMTVNKCEKAPDDENGASSICTLMSFSHAVPGMTGEWRSIVLNNDVTAGVVALAGMVKNLHEHNITGSLAVGLLGRNEVDGVPGSPQMHPWQVTYDQNLCYVNLDGTGLQTHKSRVVLSPTLPFSRLRRQ